jgi:hypothetical protein
VSAAMSVSAAVPALETAIQSKLPELEHQIRTQVGWHRRKGVPSGRVKLMHLAPGMRCQACLMGYDLPHGVWC